MNQFTPLDEVLAAGGRLAATARNLDEACWTWSPTAERWSPAAIVEHVVLVNRLGRRRLAALTPMSEPTAITDQEIPYLFYQGDEPTGLADPRGEFDDRVTALQALDQAQAELIATTDASLDLRARGAVHPLFGLMDGIQWVLFYAAHMDRHRAELIGIEREHKAARG